MNAGEAFVRTGALLRLVMLVRYFSVAGLFYLLVCKRPLRWRERELNARKPSRKGVFKISETAEQLKAAPEWVEGNHATTEH